MKQPELFETGINPVLRRTPRKTNEEKRAWQAAYRHTARAIARKTVYRALNKERLKEKAVYNAKKKLYGITPANFDRLIEEQDNRCAICKLQFSKTQRRKIPHVDHDHISGKIRALLCGNCNVAIGLMRESPAVMRAAADYIETHKDEK